MSRTSEERAEALKRQKAAQIIARMVASGELIELDNGSLIEADRFDPAVHTRA